METWYGVCVTDTLGRNGTGGARPATSRVDLHVHRHCKWTVEVREVIRY